MWAGNQGMAYYTAVLGLDVSKAQNSFLQDKALSGNHSDAVLNSIYSINLSEHAPQA